MTTQGRPDPAVYPVLTITQDEDREVLVIDAGDTVDPIEVPYGMNPTWPSPKETEDAVMAAVRTVFRQANGTDDPALWEGLDA
jgi:hypothetical protein